jgi:hypothetical protein
MIGDYRVYDADAHVILAPAMWEDLPEKYVPRRPRPATFSDAGDMAAYTSGWLIEGRVEPHILGPGLQPANTPAWVVEGRHRDTHTLMNPEGRAREFRSNGDRCSVSFSFNIVCANDGGPWFRSGNVPGIQSIYGPAVPGQFQATQMGRPCPTPRAP